MELSRTERWILVNQYRIMEALIPDAQEECRKAVEALTHGFALEYDEVCQHIYRDEETLSCPWPCESPH